MMLLVVLLLVVVVLMAVLCYQGCTSRGAQELSKVSSTLEEVQLYYTISPSPSSVCNVIQL